MDISCDKKNSPPHMQQSQMATEFTSPAKKENNVSIITSESTIADVKLPIDGDTGTSGIQDEAMNSLNSVCPNKSNNSVATTGGPTAKNKKKHRRGKPKTKNTKPYKKTNWKFQVPPYGRSQSGTFGGRGGGNNSNSSNGRRIKLNRSRSLVPYNTNKFLMEEHLAEVPSALLTPSGRTRDSSFSVDSEDNYFYSLPEDEEEFLTKEFANVYEKARTERLEMLTKQQLIEECLQMEDRYSEQGAQRQQQLNIQRISAEYLSRIRALEEKIRDLTKDNYELRRQLTNATTKAAATQRPTPMDSSSEDSESDSSSSSSSSSSKSSLSEYSVPVEPRPDNEMVIDASLSAEEEELANGISNCNGYHSARSITPPDSSSLPSSPLSQLFVVQENSPGEPGSPRSI